MEPMRRLTALIAVWLALLPAVARADGGVAVLYFENRGNAALEPLEVGIAQMLITDLTGATATPIVERARLQAVLDELKLGHEGAVAPETAAAVGKLVGAEYLVLGSFFELMGTMRVDARLVRVETGEITWAHGVDGPTNTLFELEAALSDALLHQLKGAPKRPRKGAKLRDAPPAPAPAPAPTRAVAVVAPASGELAAALRFSEGLLHLDEKDLPRAREAFEAALGVDPSLDAARTELERLSL